MKKIISGTGIFSQSLFGLPGYARVIVNLIDGAPQNYFIIQLDGKRGLEYLPDNYGNAAFSGYLYAIIHIPSTNFGIELKRVIGDWSDLSEGVIATATTLAIWNAFKFVPGQSILDHMKKCNLSERNTEGFCDPVKLFPGFLID